MNIMLQVKDSEEEEIVVRKISDMKLGPVSDLAQLGFNTGDNCRTCCKILPYPVCQVEGLEGTEPLLLQEHIHKIRCRCEMIQAVSIHSNIPGARTCERTAPESAMEHATNALPSVIETMEPQPPQTQSSAFPWGGQSDFSFPEYMGSSDLSDNTGLKGEDGWEFGPLNGRVTFAEFQSPSSNFCTTPALRPVDVLDLVDVEKQKGGKS
ncbi:unnamed protein product [Caretta caretta]